MLLLFGPKYGTGVVRTPILGKQIVRSLLMLLMPLCFVVAFTHMPMRNALAFLWATPILLLFIDRVFIRETRGWQLPVITLAGFVGAMLIIRPSLPIGWSGLVALCGSLSFAIYVSMTRTMRHEPLMPKMFHTALWVFVGLTPFVPFFWVPPTLRTLVMTSLVALFGWLTLYCLDRAVDKAPPATLAPIMYCVVLWTELSHWFLSHTTFGYKAILGSAVVAVVAGITTMSRPTVAVEV